MMSQKLNNNNWWRNINSCNQKYNLFNRNKPNSKKDKNKSRTNTMIQNKDKSSYKTTNTYWNKSTINCKLNYKQ